MHIYLAGEHPVKNGSKMRSWQELNILESFYYARKNTCFPQLYATGPANFLLDSGAFTMKQNAQLTLDWRQYVADYATFINKYRIKQFIELDIEEIIGMQQYEYLRDMLCEITGRQPVVVWHSFRGYNYWKKMLSRFEYVAIATTTIKHEGKVWRSSPQLIHRFITEAHSAGCKIHGLGYTDCSSLKNLHFDSVDSTAWLYGNMGGFAYRFNPADPALMEKIKKPAGSRLRSTETAAHNFNEWAKLTRWAERNL